MGPALIGPENVEVPMMISCRGVSAMWQSGTI